MHVGGTPQAEADHAGPRRGVGEAVDQNERPGFTIFLIRIQGDGRGRCEIAQSDLIESEGLGSHVLQRVHVHLVFEGGDTGGHETGADAHEVGAAGQHRILGHPQHVRRELVHDLGPGGGACEHITACDVDLIGEDQRDGIPGMRLRQIAIGGDDAGDLGFPAGCRHDDRFAAPDAA